MLKSIESYQNELEDANDRLEKLSFDEFGAKREHLFHKELGEIISKKIRFDSEGNASMVDSVETYIVGVTAIDMQQANSELGQHGGDFYLKKTVDKTTELFKTDKFSIYHKNGQDFTCILEAEDVTSSIQKGEEETISIGDKTLRNSLSVVKLSEIVQIYNTFAESFELNGTRKEVESKQKRIFTELLLGYSDYAREFKKTYEIGDEYLLKQNFTPEDETKYTKYVSYLYSGSKFETLAGYKETPEHNYKAIRKDFIATCKSIAERKVFGEKHGYGNYWKVVLEKFSKKRAMPTEETADVPIEVLHEIEFDSFVEKYSSERQKEYKETRAGIFELRTGIENTLSVVNALTNQEQKSVTAEAVEEFCTNIKEINKNIDTLSKYLDDKTEIQKDIATLGLTDKTKVKQLLESGADSVVLFENLLKFKFAADIAEAKFNIELCTYDYLTGIKNKDEYEKRIREIHADPESKGQVIVSDLSYLKYFNETGNRDIGNAAIQIEGFILASCAEAFEGIEVFRTGGDECAIIVPGDEEKVQAVNKFIIDLAEQIGPIPGNGKEVGHYFPKAVQFNTAYCLKNEAEQALAYMVDNNSVENASQLVQENADFNVEYYSKMVGKVQSILAANNIESLKIENRMMYLKGLIDSGQIELFDNLYYFSGKALRGIDPEDFKQLITENPELSGAALAEKVMSMQSDAGHLSASRQEIVRQMAVDFARSQVMI